MNSDRMKHNTNTNTNRAGWSVRDVGIEMCCNDREGTSEDVVPCVTFDTAQLRTPV